MINDAAYRDMTSAQAAAMHRFEDQAVAAVLDAHGLPASDASDVRNWASDEAAGVLQLLVFEAISTSPDERTFDQKQIAGWMGDLMAARTRPGMMQVGAEYAAWAGLSVSRYWELVNSSASQSELTAFLSRRPQPYNGSSPETSTGGFCKYVPPAPYADEYKGREWQTCFTPCTRRPGQCATPRSNSTSSCVGVRRGLTAGVSRVRDKGVAYVRHHDSGGSCLAASAAKPGKGVDAENTMLRSRPLPPVPTTGRQGWMAKLRPHFFDGRGKGRRDLRGQSPEIETKNLFRQEFGGRPEAAGRCSRRPRK